MGQKVSPIGFRTGVTIGWKSRWFAPKSNFGEFLVEDEKVRRFIDDRLNRRPPYAAISSVEIERTREEVKISVQTARPGLVIGPRGAEVDKLREALEDLTNRRVSINIVEVRKPDLDAQLTAEGVAEQLKRRGSYRRILKQRAEAAMQAGAKGVKIIIAGRLGGREIATRETKIMGSIPLHTLEADVDYGFAPSFTNYGTIGVKVWIYRGIFGEQQAEAQEEDKRSDTMTRARRRRQRSQDDGLGRPGPPGPGGRGRSRSPGRPAAVRSGPAKQAEAPPAEAPSPDQPDQAPQTDDTTQAAENSSAEKTE